MILVSIPDFIKETSSKIRHAVIGGEITNTIADGIEKIAGVAQDSTDTTKEIEEYIKAVELEWDSDPNKDPEVLEARGGQPRLKDRFENTDRQLAQTMTVAETSTVTKNRIPNNEIPSSKLATTTQDDRIKLVNLHEEVHAAMTGQTSVGNIPENGTVTIEKLAPQLQTMFIQEGSDWGNE